MECNKQSGDNPSLELFYLGCIFYIVACFCVFYLLSVFVLNIFMFYGVYFLVILCNCEALWTRNSAGSGLAEGWVRCWGHFNFTFVLFPQEELRELRSSSLDPKETLVLHRLHRLLLYPLVHSSTQNWVQEPSKVTFIYFMSHLSCLSHINLSPQR